MTDGLRAAELKDRTGQVHSFQPAEAQSSPAQSVPVNQSINQPTQTTNQPHWGTINNDKPSIG